MTSEQKVRRAAKMLANVRDSQKFSEAKNAAQVRRLLNDAVYELGTVVEMLKEPTMMMPETMPKTMQALRELESELKERRAK